MTLGMALGTLLIAYAVSFGALTPAGTPSANAESSGYRYWLGADGDDQRRLENPSVKNSNIAILYGFEPGYTWETAGGTKYQNPNTGRNDPNVAQFDALESIVNALRGTPTSLGIYTVDDQGAPASWNSNDLQSTSIGVESGYNAVVDKIHSLTAVNPNDGVRKAARFGIAKRECDQLQVGLNNVYQDMLENPNRNNYTDLVIFATGRVCDGLTGLNATRNLANQLRDMDVKVHMFASGPKANMTNANSFTGNSGSGVNPNMIGTVYKYRHDNADPWWDVDNQVMNGEFEEMLRAFFYQDTTVTMVGNIVDGNYKYVKTTQGWKYSIQKGSASAQIKTLDKEGLWQDSSGNLDSTYVFAEQVKDGYHLSRYNGMNANCVLYAPPTGSAYTWNGRNYRKNDLKAQLPTELGAENVKVNPDYEGVRLTVRPKVTTYTQEYGEKYTLRVAGRQIKCTFENKPLRHVVLNKQVTFIKSPPVLQAEMKGNEYSFEWQCSDNGEVIATGKQDAAKPFVLYDPYGQPILKDTGTTDPAHPDSPPSGGTDQLTLTNSDGTAAEIPLGATCRITDIVPKATNDNFYTITESWNAIGGVTNAKQDLSAPGEQLPSGADTSKYRYSSANLTVDPIVPAGLLANDGTVNVATTAPDVLRSTTTYESKPVYIKVNVRQLTKTGDGNPTEPMPTKVPLYYNCRYANDPNQKPPELGQTDDRPGFVGTGTILVDPTKDIWLPGGTETKPNAGWPVGTQCVVAVSAPSFSNPTPEQTELADTLNQNNLPGWTYTSQWESDICQHVDGGTPDPLDGAKTCDNNYIWAQTPGEKTITVTNTYARDRNGRVPVTKTLVNGDLGDGFNQRKTGYDTATYAQSEQFPVQLSCYAGRTSEPTGTPLYQETIKVSANRGASFTQVPGDSKCVLHEDLSSLVEPVTTGFTTPDGTPVTKIGGFDVTSVSPDQTFEVGNTADITAKSLSNTLKPKISESSTSFYPHFEPEDAFDTAEIEVLKNARIMLTSTVTNPVAMNTYQIDKQISGDGFGTSGRYRMGDVVSWALKDGKPAFEALGTQSAITREEYDNMSLTLVPYIPPDAEPGYVPQDALRIHMHTWGDEADVGTARPSVKYSLVWKKLTSGIDVNVVTDFSGLGGYDTMNAEAGPANHPYDFQVKCTDSNGAVTTHNYTVNTVTSTFTHSAPVPSTCSVAMKVPGADTYETFSQSVKVDGQAPTGYGTGTGISDSDTGQDMNVTGWQGKNIEMPSTGAPQAVTFRVSDALKYRDIDPYAPVALLNANPSGAADTYQSPQTTAAFLANTSLPQTAQYKVTCTHDNPTGTATDTVNSTINKRLVPMRESAWYNAVNVAATQVPAGWDCTGKFVEGQNEAGNDILGIPKLTGADATAVGGVQTGLSINNPVDPITSSHLGSFNTPGDTYTTSGDSVFNGTGLVYRVQNAEFHVKKKVGGEGVSMVSGDDQFKYHVSCTLNGQAVPVWVGNYSGGSVTSWTENPSGVADIQMGRFEQGEVHPVRTIAGANCTIVEKADTVALRDGAAWSSRWTTTGDLRGRGAEVECNTAGGGERACRVTGKSMEGAREGATEAQLPNNKIQITLPVDTGVRDNIWKQSQDGLGYTGPEKLPENYYGTVISWDDYEMHKTTIQVEQVSQVGTNTEDRLAQGTVFDYKLRCIPTVNLPSYITSSPDYSAYIIEQSFTIQGNDSVTVQDNRDGVYSGDLLVPYGYRCTLTQQKEVLNDSSATYRVAELDSINAAPDPDPAPVTLVSKQLNEDTGDTTVAAIANFDVPQKYTAAVGATGATPLKFRATNNITRDMVTYTLAKEIPTVPGTGNEHLISATDMGIGTATNLALKLSCIDRSMPSTKPYEYVYSTVDDTLTLDGATTAAVQVPANATCSVSEKYPGATTDPVSKFINTRADHQVNITEVTPGVPGGDPTSIKTVGPRLGSGFQTDTQQAFISDLTGNRIAGNTYNIEVVNRYMLDFGQVGVGLWVPPTSHADETMTAGQPHANEYVIGADDKFTYKYSCTLTDGQKAQVPPGYRDPVNGQVQLGRIPISTTGVDENNHNDLVYISTVAGSRCTLAPAVTETDKVDASVPQNVKEKVTAKKYRLTTLAGQVTESDIFDEDNQLRRPPSFLGDNPAIPIADWPADGLVATVPADASNTYVAIVNQVWNNAQPVQVRKVDADGNTVALDPSAQFVIYPAKTTATGTTVADTSKPISLTAKDGETGAYLANLEPGSYWLEETRGGGTGADASALLSERWPFNVVASQNQTGSYTEAGTLNADLQIELAGYTNYSGVVTKSDVRAANWTADNPTMMPSIDVADVRTGVLPFTGGWLLWLLAGGALLVTAGFAYMTLNVGSLRAARATHRRGGGRHSH
ncbi:MAG: DUF5979 domain-containing protein [Varibaculum sp.]|nr:DUF5979 domain-containing protein [Varibaculum sp.]